MLIPIGRNAYTFANAKETKSTHLAETPIRNVYAYSNTYPLSFRGQPMPIITIREQQKTVNGFEAIVSFDGRVEYTVTIADPFTAQEEKRLAWYFEEFVTFPLML